MRAILLTILSVVCSISLNTVITFVLVSRARHESFDCGYIAGFNAGLLGCADSDLPGGRPI